VQIVGGKIRPLIPIDDEYPTRQAPHDDAQAKGRAGGKNCMGKTASRFIDDWRTGLQCLVSPAPYLTATRVAFGVILLPYCAFPWPGAPGNSGFACGASCPQIESAIA
jgi:hypothetical protein